MGEGDSVDEGLDLEQVELGELNEDRVDRLHVGGKVYSQQRQVDNDLQRVDHSPQHLQTRSPTVSHTHAYRKKLRVKEAAKSTVKVSTAFTVAISNA